MTNCADFLRSLFQKGPKYRAISGYRSMLSVMLPNIDGTPIGQHTDITRLLKECLILGYQLKFWFQSGI